MIFFIALVYSLKGQMPNRVSLFEDFTGENCGPCSLYNPSIDEALIDPSISNKVIALKWMVPIPNAPTNMWSLYQTNKSEINYRMSYCNVTSAPQSMLDGQSQVVFGAGGDHPAYANAYLFSTSSSYTTPFSISLNTTWNASFNTATVNVIVNSSDVFNAVGNLMFNLCLVERQINYDVAPGTNREKYFENAVRKSYPTTTSGGVTTSMGTLINSSWLAGQTQTLSIVCNIPTYINDLSQMSFVGFIQDNGDHKVWQSSRTAKPIVPNDIKVKKVLVTPYSCSGIITPTVVVSNVGSSTITSIDLNTYLDGVFSVHSFTTSILSATDFTIVLPPQPVLGHGVHSYSVNIVNVSGGDINLNNNKAITSFYLVQSYTTTLPFIREFNFPISTLLSIPDGWFVVNPNIHDSYFSIDELYYTSTHAGTSTSIKYNFYESCNKQSGMYGTTALCNTSEELYLPTLNVSGGTYPTLKFDLAYQQYFMSNDKLEILYSTDCGANWNSVYNKSGNILATNTNSTSGWYFAPSASDWRTEEVDLPINTVLTPSVLIKFVVTSDNGNNLYLDNFNVFNKTLANIKQIELENAFTFYPNPTSNILHIISTINFNSIRIYNNLQQLVYYKDENLEAKTAVDISHFSAGIYFIEIKSLSGSVIKKIIKN